jgi:hypothetical protein
MVKKSFDARIEQEVCTRYKGGESSVQLANEYGVSKHTILGVLKRNDVERRTSAEAAKTRRSDKDTIVIPDMANLQPVDKYWLGFILGDGCIFYPTIENQSKILSVTLKSSDKFHLERLSRYFNSQRQISTTKSQEGKIGDRVVKESEKCLLQIVSDPLIEYLEHFGIHQRKSGKEKAHPALSNSRDFWRGLIDADGSLYQAENQARLSLTGSNEICQQFKTYLVANLGTEYEQSPIKEKEGCFELVVGGNIKANKIIRHLYYNSCMALTRKLILAMQLNCAKFEFRRLKDVSGVSGTGVVAEGCVFRNQKVALAWCASDIKSVVIYDSLEEMFQIHNHEENSYIVWKEFGDENA